MYKYVIANISSVNTAVILFIVYVLYLYFISALIFRLENSNVIILNYIFVTITFKGIEFHEVPRKAKLRVLVPQ